MPCLPRARRWRLRARLRPHASGPTCRAARALCLALTVALSACASATLDRALDGGEADRAGISGFGTIRTTLDAGERDAPFDPSTWMPATQRGAIDILMISGGGAGGAFSVGALTAWSARGTRPDFDVITGVSTGALIAPYAFLGPAYDDALTQLFTSGVAENLVQTNGPAGLFGTSLLRPDPLRKLVEAYMTPQVLHAIAVEHRKGRRLFVSTTNLDSQRAVVWNLGAIAASGHPDALRLTRDILIASASVPGMFPAVMIRAEANGHQFEEMHSDGGSTSQVLLLPQAFLASGSKPIDPRLPKTTFYALVNNTLIPEFAATPDGTLPVLARAYSIFIKSQTKSELTALYNYTQRVGARYRLAYIHDSVPYSMSDPFNTTYMRAVYGIGSDRMRHDTLWLERPVFR